MNLGLRLVRTCGGHARVSVKNTGARPYRATVLIWGLIYSVSSDDQT